MSDIVKLSNDVVKTYLLLPRFNIALRTCLNYDQDYQNIAKYYQNVVLYYQNHVWSYQTSCTKISKSRQIQCKFSMGLSKPFVIISKSCKLLTKSCKYYQNLKRINKIFSATIQMCLPLSKSNMALPKSFLLSITFIKMLSKSLLLYSRL